MHQLSQKLKSGEMKIQQVPAPNCGRGFVVVHNHFSLISAGTETSTVSAARKSLVGKAKERPQQVKQVIDVLKSQGPSQTYRAVMKKLDAWSALGYSSVGEIIDIGSENSEFKIGDMVACGGLSACHAEIVAVPDNLTVKLSEETDLRQATYNTLGAIALQGIRQADLRLGETCAVIGLGLIGQLTGLMLRASGVRTIGIDINDFMVDLAGKHCADLALNRNTEGIETAIDRFTSGLGCDAVIITAASSSLDPINFAGTIARKRGTVVVVGAVPTGFDRDPHYYRKELQVRMSCSYGPGRYDPNYEEKGIDYPPAYVRWTEKRNMQAFQELIASRKIDVSYLTTHTFKLEDAPKAYDMMMAGSEPFVGILIEYDTSKPIARGRIAISVEPKAAPADSATIGFIGAGSYAQSHLLPNIPKSDHVVLKGVATATGNSSRSVAERFKFDFCAPDGHDLINDPDINTLFIATRHDSHAKWVLEALKAGKNVFVEKPLCLSEDELQQIIQAISPSNPRTLESSNPILMVGYNRRFSPLAEQLKNTFHDMPLAMTYRVNAGAIPPDSWIQDPDVGGGRILGEVCHFVDFLSFVCGALPVSVSAAAMDDPHHLNDTLNVSLGFADGSIGTITYCANGAKNLPKERIEVHGGQVSAVLDDFKSLTVYAKGKTRTKKLLTQDKGQKNEVRRFIQVVRNGGPAPIPFEEIRNTSITTFKIIESIRTGRTLKIE